MARDPDGIFKTKWAETGDVQDPAAAGLDRSEGWPISYSTTGGPAPEREVFNQLLRELYALGVEVNCNGPFLEWDAGLDYGAGAVIRGSDGLLYLASAPSGPSTAPQDPSGGGAPLFWGEFSTGSGGGGPVIPDDGSVTLPKHANGDPDTILGFAPITGAPQYIPRSSLGSNPFLHVQDQKPSGTSGGNLVAGVWTTMVLNTVLTNEITGSFLSGNQVTLPAGTYLVEGSSQGLQCNRHQTRVQNITSNATALLGTIASSEALAGANDTATSVVVGQFTLATPSIIELQHISGSNSILSDAGGFGVEVYSDLRIWSK